MFARRFSPVLVTAVHGPNSLRGTGHQTVRASEQPRALERVSRWGLSDGGQVCVHCAAPAARGGGCSGVAVRHAHAAHVGALASRRRAGWQTRLLLAVSVAFRLRRPPARLGVAPLLYFPLPRRVLPCLAVSCRVLPCLAVLLRSEAEAARRLPFLRQVGLLLVAGAPWHVCGNAADRDTSDELPVVGRDAGVASQYDAKKHTLNAPGDEQIPDPPAPNDEEALLKEALSDEAPVESMEDDPEFHEKYQPTYEYEGDDDEADAEGQDESDGLQAVLQAEKAYFIARDHDGDGELSKDEFIRQLNEVDTDEEDSMWDTWNASARGRPAPSREELMFGKDWTARVSAEQASTTPQHLCCA